ncbi:homeobox-leucine zipper protein HOX1-like [Iris pallida]|uniref:Homeobox-leucine zipper protein HOX1-like n=1 Tax=Iris pallida TaxID=29817 RepID=A0AAX6H829_IRIPA|nr:homeobox-leucine zipper protein HOX1-like [Iris pallida]
MMVGKEADLGLSLSLGPQSAPRHLLAMAPKPHWTELASAGERRLRGIDVNRAPVAAAERESEEDYAAGGASSSPNSAVSSVMSGGAGKGPRGELQRRGRRRRVQEEAAAVQGPVRCLGRQLQRA